MSKKLPKILIILDQHTLSSQKSGWVGGWVVRGLSPKQIEQKRTVGRRWADVAAVPPAQSPNGEKGGHMLRYLNSLRSMDRPLILCT